MGNSLAKVMADKSDQILELVDKYSQSTVKIKSDQSPVTQLDLELSNYIENLHRDFFSFTSFYSEENHGELNLPSLVVDPLDGTREFINGSDEWSISVALLLDDNFQGEAWINNPIRNEIFCSPSKLEFKEKSEYKGEVSRWEFESGLYKKKLPNRFSISPKGSIAYKLGRLSYGEIDFVVSLKPKNIWDIAAGIILCNQRGLCFYSEGKLVDRVKPVYQPPLIWCPSELAPELLSFFS